MSEKDPNHDPKPTPPVRAINALAYEAPMDRIDREGYSNKLGIVAAWGFGFGLASAIAAFIGVLTYAMIQGDHFIARIIGALYASAMILVAWPIRKTRNIKIRTLKQWMYLGALIGLCITFLLQGLCFGLQ